MIVTQHARFTAMFRVLRKNNIVGVHDRWPFHCLDQEWSRDCGLRHADLLRTVDELVLGGGFRLCEISEGFAIELTDRGVLQMQRRPQPSGRFRWVDRISELSQQINTTRVLAWAKQRISRGAMTAAKPRIPESERRSMALSADPRK